MAGDNDSSDSNGASRVNPSGQGNNNAPQETSAGNTRPATNPQSETSQDTERVGTERRNNQGNSAQIENQGNEHRTRNDYSPGRQRRKSPESLVDILTSDWGLTIRLVLAAGAVGLFYYIAAGLLSIFFVSSLDDGSAFLAGVGLTVGLMYVFYRQGLHKQTTGENISEYPVDANPQLHSKIDELAANMGISRPFLMRRQMGMPNAYAVGRAGNGYIVLSDWLIDSLSQDELEAVVAHEMAHLKHRGSIIQALSATALTIIQYAVMLVVGIYGFALALLRYSNYRMRDKVQLAFRSLQHGYTGAAIAAVGSLVASVMLIFTRALSRYREYLADRRAASTIGGHQPMASALQTIESEVKRADTDIEDSDVPLSLCIHGRKDSIIGKLLADHPPVEKRINRLNRAFNPPRTPTPDHQNPPSGENQNRRQPSEQSHGDNTGQNHERSTQTQDQ